LVLDRPIRSVSVRAPEETRLGGRATLDVVVREDREAAVAAVLPLHVEVRDPAGRSFEASGHYAARDGRLALTLDIAANDRPGEWRARVQELASGLVGETRFRVNAP
jgi:hypothetical protein